MDEKGERKSSVMINRAAVVAEVLGFEHDEALTLGRAVAGLNAYSKGVSLGLFQPTPKEVQEQRRKMRKEETVTVSLLHRAVPGQPRCRPTRELRRSAPPARAAARDPGRRSAATSGYFRKTGSRPSRGR
jgi:hypothetical protein